MHNITIGLEISWKIQELLKSLDTFIKNGIVNFIRHSRNEKISDAGGVFELETEASEYTIAQRQKMAKLQEVHNVAFELLVEK